MRTTWLAGLVAGGVCALLVGGCSSGASNAPSADDGTLDPQATGEQGMHGAPEHLFLGRGEAGRPGGGSPLMTSHGGTVLPTNKTKAIFWGPKWATSWENGKIAGLDEFFTGFGGSNYAKASTEYAGTNGQVTATSTYLGHEIDTRPAPSKALSVSSAVSEACSITNNAPDPSALYLIYTETGAGHVNYCAWHSWGSCSNGAPVQVAYMPNIDGLAGCDPQDTWTPHSQGLAALANVTAHELSEAITDPRGAGWFDSSGAENGDKCAWTFNARVTLHNGSTWKLQGEWSNAAYNNNTGYPNRSGQNGCLDGACDASPATVCAGKCGSIDTCAGTTVDCGPCPYCGDGTCQANEDATSCPADCSVPTP